MFMSCSQPHPEKLTLEITEQDLNSKEPVLEAFSRSVKTKNVGYRQNYDKPELFVFDKDTVDIAVYTLPDNFKHRQTGRYVLYKKD